MAKYNGKQVKANMDRFKRLMKSCGNDTTLIVLKGHLIIEEQLMAIIEDELRHQEILEAGRLRFSQKLDMTQFILKSKMDDCFKTTFKAIHLLNHKLRNPLAHRLEHQDMELRVNQFCEFVEKDIAPLANHSGQGTNRLLAALGKLYVATTAMRLVANEVKANRNHNAAAELKPKATFAFLTK